MLIYDQIATKIIKEQELLMGNVAWDQASKVNGLQIDRKSGLISIQSDGENVINNLVDRFGNIFGRAGREVCKEAVNTLIADMEAAQIPSSLR